MDHRTDHEFHRSALMPQPVAGCAQSEQVAFNDLQISSPTAAVAVATTALRASDLAPCGHRPERPRQESGSRL